MKTLILSLIAIAFIGLSFVPAADDDLLEWSEETALVWDDFNGKPPVGSKFKAMTHSRIGLDAKFDEGSFIIDVNTYFIRNKSWSKNKGSEDLLAHEQVHFDIAELIARKIRKAYSEYTATDVQETGDFLQETYNEYYGPVWDSYNAYDEETHHGLIEEEQAKWAKKIQNELEELKDYSSPHITIKLIE